MIVYSTICKANGNDKRSIVLFIISGFVGSLKDWWDNDLTNNQWSEVLNAVKQKHNEVGQIIEQPDVIYTLIQAIVF